MASIEITKYETLDLVLNFYKLIQNSSDTNAGDVLNKFQQHQLKACQKYFGIIYFQISENLISRRHRLV